MFNFKKKPLSEDAQYIKDIVISNSENDNIKKMISPISDEYFLIDNENQISICISDGKIVFSNHVFLYEKTFNLSFTDSLKKLVKENMEIEMQDLKKSLFKNETALLSKVLRLANKPEFPLIINHNFKKTS